MPRRVSASASPRSLHLLCALCVVSLFFLSVGCGRHNTTDPSSLAFLVESNPTNLDPRYATDSQSQKIDALLFDFLAGLTSLQSTR